MSICKIYNLEDLLPLNTITQESVTLLGMILIENDEIFLATDVEEVKLDIQTLGEFEFYTGLYCALVGTNPTGKAFVVDEVKSFNFNETIKDEDGTEKQIQNTSKYLKFLKDDNSNLEVYLFPVAPILQQIHYQMILSMNWSRKSKKQSRI